MSDDEDSAGRCTRLEECTDTDQDRQRGQADPRLILGAIVTVVLAGPLATAAADIQSAVAAVPGFSWLSATFIAVLIVGAVLAATLGVE